MGKSWNYEASIPYAKRTWKEDDAELDKYQMRGGTDPRSFLEYYGDEDSVDEYDDLLDDEDWEDEELEEESVGVYTVG